jgi:hypothetical protein
VTGAVFTVRVGFSTNDDVKAGVVALGFRDVAVLADTEEDAHLAACQVVATAAVGPFHHATLVGAMPTSSETVGVRV